MNQSRARYRLSRTALALWVSAVIVAGIVIPFGGFAVVLASRLPVFARVRPPWLPLVLLAAALVVIQLIGLQAARPLVQVGPAEVVGG
jgi:hypothetical protein